MWNKYLGLLVTLLCFVACNQKGTMEKAGIEIKGERFIVEVARTAGEQQRGLMFRKKLGDREGMLFVYAKYVRVGFWMKNTGIPLSIAFIADTGEILDIKNMIPFSEKTVMPAYSYRYALEVNKGVLEELGVREGDFITIPPGI